MDIVIINTVKEGVSGDEIINKDQFRTETANFEEDFKNFCDKSELGLEKYLFKKIVQNAEASGTDWPTLEIRIVVESKILFGDYLNEDRFSGQARFLFKDAILPSYRDAYYQAVEKIGIGFWNEIMSTYKEFFAFIN